MAVWAGAAQGARSAGSWTLARARRPMLVDNYEWLSRLEVIAFLRDIGKEFPVGAMLAKESVRARLWGRRRHLLQRVHLSGPDVDEFPRALMARGFPIGR